MVRSRKTREYLTDAEWEAIKKNASPEARAQIEAQESPHTDVIREAIKNAVSRPTEPFQPESQPESRPEARFRERLLTPEEREYEEAASATNQRTHEEKVASGQYSRDFNNHIYSMNQANMTRKPGVKEKAKDLFHCPPGSDCARQRAEARALTRDMKRLGVDPKAPDAGEKYEKALAQEAAYQEAKDARYRRSPEGRVIEGTKTLIGKANQVKIPKRQQKTTSQSAINIYTQAEQQPRYVDNRRLIRQTIPRRDHLDSMDDIVDSLLGTRRREPAPQASGPKSTFYRATRRGEIMAVRADPATARPAKRKMKDLMRDLDRGPDGFDIL